MLFEVKNRKSSEQASGSRRYELTSLIDLLDIQLLLAPSLLPSSWVQIPLIRHQSTARRYGSFAYREQVAFTMPRCRNLAATAVPAEAERSSRWHRPLAFLALPLPDTTAESCSGCGSISPRGRPGPKATLISRTLVRGTHQTGPDPRPGRARCRSVSRKHHRPHPPAPSPRAFHHPCAKHPAPGSPMALAPAPGLRVQHQTLLPASVATLQLGPGQFTHHA